MRTVQVTAGLRAPRAIAELGFLVRWIRLRSYGGAGYFRVGPRCRVQSRGEGSIEIASGVHIRGDLNVYSQGHLRIGQKTFINRWVSIACYTRVDIGDRVRLGERVSIHDADHWFEPLPLSSADENAYESEPIQIGDGCWLGANVVLLRGSRLGVNCVVAANSVVRGEFPDNCLIAGAPARVIRQLRTSATHPDEPDRRADVKP